MIDSTSDVGRVENVHFNTHYWLRSGYGPIETKDAGKLVPQFAMANLEAFIFARADWEDVLDTFVWGAKVGYHFVKSADGACNGQFTGIMADDCRVPACWSTTYSRRDSGDEWRVHGICGRSRNAGIVISEGMHRSGTVPQLQLLDDTRRRGAGPWQWHRWSPFNSCHFRE